MKKDFKKWNNAKTEIDNSPRRLFFHERKVWWCSIGVNVGFEQDGKGEYFARPVIIFKKFNNEVFWGIPLSTKIKKGKFYVPVELGDGVPRVAIISQLRLIDGKRLYQKLGVIRMENHKNLAEAVIYLCKTP
ncbi:MAG: type II toxin-antitoxin system PemK/MazF family toxin [Patescibacteria group bacterium]